MSTENRRELPEPLALGGTAEIYPWEPGWVLKLYFERYPQNFAAFEQRMAQAICATGLPVPAVGEIVQVNGRFGLLYERCPGEMMGEHLAKHPHKIFAFGRMLADLHLQMHARPFQAEIPALHERLAYKLRDAQALPADLRAAALAALEKMPVGDRLCHGDFHFGNVLLDQPSPVIIDWVDASIGNPWADVARTSLLLQGYATLDVSGFTRWGVLAFRAVYLRRYFQRRPEGRAGYRRWLPIVAAARLNERIRGWDDWLLAQARKLR